MIYDTGEKHLVEIDHVSVLEAIDERFDSITSLMTQNAVMYGSTVTSLIAKTPIVGDLDIAVSNQEYGKLTRRIASSVKWLQVDGPTVVERGIRLSTQSMAVKSTNRYGKAKQLPISKVVSFQAVNNARIQIMEAKSMTGDLLEDAISIVRKVDFVFCGMALDRYGRMLETIPHAYDDCINKIIRIGKYQPRTDVKQLRYRIHKYVKRGWSLTFSIDQAMHNLDIAKKKHAEAMAAKAKRKKPARSFSNSGMKLKRSNDRGIVIEISRALRSATKVKTSLPDIISSCAAKNFNIGMRYSTNAHGNSECWQRDGKHLTISQMKTITKDVSTYLLERFGISEDVIAKTARSIESEVSSLPKKYITSYS